MDDIQEYFRKLLKLGLESSQIPSKLFKYRALNENTYKIFIDSSLWFSNPLDFNDPFDCQHELDTNNTEKEIIDFLRQTGDISEEKILQAAENIVKSPHYWKEMNTKIIQTEINKTGLLCLSEKNNDILMWSHYSNCHKGIVLGFDLWQDLDFFSPIFSIKYEKDYPVFNYLRDKDKFVEKLIRSKSCNWSYEKEYRVMKRNNIGRIQFKKEALKEVIFGCNCPKDEIERIKNLATMCGFNPTFSQAQKNNTHYELDIKSITI